jgi:excinuclease UvrABC ATPase subunit
MPDPKFSLQVPTLKRGEKQPRMIQNPLYCERCEGRGYLVGDAEWEPYAVQCDECKDRRSPKPAQ